MGTLVATVLSSIVVAILRHLAHEAALRKEGQYVQYEAALYHAEQAQQYRARPDASPTLRVRDGATPITLRCPCPDPPGSTPHA